MSVHERGEVEAGSHLPSGRVLAALLFVSVLTVCCLVLFGGSDSSDAAGETSGTCGENLTWSYDPSTGALTISGTGDMADYEYGDTRWGGNAIRSVSISDGITGIGSYAFYDCKQMTSVAMPNTLTSVGNHAFGGCSALSSVTIPDSVIHIGIGSFYGCSALSSVTIPDSVETIGNQAFYRCSSLTTVSLGSAVSSIASLAFGECPSLTSIGVHPYNKKFLSDDGVLLNRDGTRLIQYPCAKTDTTYVISNIVTTISDEAFLKCRYLTTLEVTSRNPNYSAEGGVLFNKEKTQLICYPCAREDSTYSIPSSVTEIGKYAFYDCDALTNIYVGNSVSDIGNYAFAYCSSLESVTMGSSVRYIEYCAFYMCESLASVTIGSSVSNIGVNAFAYCHLVSVTIPSSVTSIGNFAFECELLFEVVNLSSLNITIGSEENGRVGYYAKNIVTSVRDSTVEVIDGFVCGRGGGTNYVIEYIGDETHITFPAAVKGGNYEIYDNIFYRNESIITVTIPAATSIGDWAFYSCKSLASVTIGSSVNTIGDGAFYGCYHLFEVINLSGLDISKGSSDHGYVARYAKNVFTSVDDSNVEVVGDYVFGTSEGTWYLIESLTENRYVDLVSINDRSYAISGYAFYEDAVVERFTTGPGSVTSIEDFAFGNCTSLETFVIGSSVTHIGIFAFTGCTSLGRPYVVDNNAYYSEDGNVLFNKDKTELIMYPLGRSGTSYDVPDSVTTIGPYAFDDCRSLESIYLPESVIQIDYYAFNECYNLVNVSISCASKLKLVAGAANYGGVAWNAASITTVHDLTHHKAVAATCTTSGNSAYDTCSRCDYTTYQSIPALGHDYSATYDWADDGSTCTVHIVCANNPAHNHDIVDVTSQISAETPGATCSTMGTTTYSVSGTYNGFAYSSTKDVQDIPAIGHDYSATYDWANDGSTCTVHIVCSRDAAHNHDIENIASQSSVLTPATCTVAGTTRYTVSGTYDGYNYSSTKDVQDIPALRHDYSATYDWADDGSTCTVHIVCSRDAAHNHDIENIAPQSSVLTPAACTTAGTTRYSISGTYNGFAYSSTKDIQDIPALRHDYSATYDWADDGSTCTVHIVCANDAAHNHDIDASVGVATSSPATCISAGYTRYYVSGTYDGFNYYSTKDVQDIPAIGHSYSATYEWAADGSACRVYLDCANDGSHNVDLGMIAPQSSVLIPAACTTAGTTRYTVSGTYDGFAYSSVKDVQDIPAIGHDYSATYDWADDGSTCTVHIVCSRDAAHNHDIENIASQSSVLTPAVCTTAGTTRYSISGTYDGFSYSSTKDVQDIPAPGHPYTARYIWEDDGSACRVYLDCANDGSHNVDLGMIASQSSVLTPATCTVAGTTRYSISGTYEGFSYSSTKDVQDIPASHAYSATYDWADDGSTCTVHIVCANDAAHNHDIDASVGVATSSPATCISAGYTRYYVSGTYDGFNYYSTKDVQDIPAIGHSYSATYEWAADGSTCTVHIVCSRDAAHNHDIENIASQSSVLTPATCTVAGTTRYTVSGTYEGFSYSSTKDVQDIPAIGHDYSATYDWANDGSTCTVHIVCANDAAHNHDIENIVPQSSVLTPAACTTAGTTRYTVSGTYDGFNYSSTKDVQDIPAIGHSYSATYEWAADGSSCNVHVICARDPAHNHDVTAVAASSVKTAASVGSMGTTTYSISGTYDGFDYSSTKDVQDIPALEPAITQKEEGGTTTYANSVSPNVSTQVTDLFNTAKTNGGSAEVSVPSSATSAPVTITFDGAAVNAIGGNDVSITASMSVNSSDISGAELIIEVSLQGATFSQGKAKVTVPLKESVPDGKVVKVYFIDGDRKVDMNATMVDGNVVFETNHFSTYAVFFEDTPSEDNGGGFPILFVVIGVVAVLALIGGAVVLRRRHV